MAYDSLPTMGGNTARGSASGNVGGDARVEIGGSGIWEIDTILASYYTGQVPTAGTENLTNLAGRLLVIDGSLSSAPSITPYNVANPDPLISNVPIAGILLDMPFNFAMHSGNFPVILNFPRNSGIGGLRSTDGGKLTVLLVAGRGWSASAAGVVFCTYQFLHVCAHMVGS